MFIKNIEIKNFRLLKNVTLTLQKESTVIVGRNNSGKTSLTEIFRRFFSGKNPAFTLADFSLASLDQFGEALKAKIKGNEEPLIRNLIPSIDLYITIDYSDNKDDYGALSEFIIDLDENTTEAKIKFSYEFKKVGKLDTLFYGLTSNDKTELYKVLKENIPNLFSIYITAIDPTDQNNFTSIEFSKLSHCIGIDFINAQRGLDDVTQSEKDVLGKVLSNIFKSATSHTAPPEMQLKSKELEDIVHTLQETIDTDFKEKVNALLPSLENFGYPGLSDPNLSTETSLDVKTILESNTKIRYQQEDGITFPETYNGLGSRNLIYILFKLFEFFRNFQSNPIEIQNHLVFIE
jgi:putative ATP-dependent endonuclease of the OLD family